METKNTWHMEIEKDNYWKEMDKIAKDRKARKDVVNGLCSIGS